MAKTKHTPGPWYVQDEYENTIPIDAPVSSTSYDESVEVCRVSAQTDEQKANARLIAAAPELLAALETIIQAESNGFADGLNWSTFDKLVARANGE